MDHTPNLTPEAFNELFHYWISFDKDLKVTDISSKLRELIKAPQMHSPLFDSFEIQTPENLLDFEMIKAHKSVPLFMKSKLTGVCFRGQVVENNSKLTYLCYPWSLNYRTFESWGISLDDYPPYSLCNDLLSIKEELENRSLQAELLYKAAASVAANLSVEESYAAMLMHICTQIGWPVGHVYVIDQTNTELLLPTKIWYLDDKENKYRAFKEVTEKTNFEIGKGLPGRILQSKKPAWIVNVQTDPNFPRAKLCNNINVKGAFGFPIFFKGEIIAVLEFFADNEILPNETLLSIMENVGWQMSLCIEKVDVQKQLLETKDEAINALQTKSKFLSMMSHEIRTPLNVILGMSDLLSETLRTEEQVQYNNAVRRAGELLTNIINDILDLSKLEAGLLTIEPVGCNLLLLVKEIFESMKVLIPSKKIELKYYISQDIPEKIMIDEKRLQQILVNLIGNAIKYTKEGQVSLSIELEHKNLKFSVKDTGSGISKDKLETIFEPFTQLEAARGGTGLGLSICKNLAKLMHGTLNVISEEGQGSVFILTLPLKYGLDNSSELIEKEAQTTLKPLKILLVDDSIDNRQLIQAYCKHTPYTIDEAENGAIALKLYHENNYDLILLDMQMPEVDGYGVVQEIRAHETGSKHIPVIAITAYAQKEDAQKCLSAGCDAYLPKPLKRDVLFSKIQEVA